MKIILSVLLICIGAVTVSAADKPFAGTFANEELTVRIIPIGDAFSGEFKLAGQTFPLTAQESEKTLRGKFKSEEGAFDFTAVLNENILTLKTEDTTYKLIRRPTNPLAGKPSPLAKTDETSSTSTNVLSAMPAWKVYKHATGLSMAYPPDWQLKPFPQGLQLIPPDAGSNEKGPTEAYLVFAESAEGIATAEDPRVLAYIETQLLQVAPFFRRSGDVEKIRAGTAPGICAIWEGTNPDGLKVQAQTLSTILKGYGISVVALGETGRIKSREKTIRTIFASFAAGAAEKDPHLVGTWKFWSYSASADGKFGTERSRMMTLQSDGTVLWKGRSESSGSVSGRDYLGNETFSGGVAGQTGSADRGFWSAGEGKLYVRWQDGSTGEWSYRLGGVPGNGRLFLQTADQKKPDEWVQAGP